MASIKNNKNTSNQKKLSKKTIAQPKDTSLEKMKGVFKKRAVKETTEETVRKSEQPGTEKKTGQDKSATEAVSEKNPEVKKEAEAKAKETAVEKTPTEASKEDQTAEKNPAEKATETKAVETTEKTGKSEKAKEKPKELPAPVTPPYIPVELLEEKESRWKTPENKRLLKRASVLIGIFLIPALLCLYFISPLSRLQKVNVSGNLDVPTAEIKEKADFKVGSGIWGQYFNRKNKIATLKKQEPRIKSVSIYFDSINTFKIAVKEYKEVALLAQNNKYAPIIENGHVIPETIEKADGSEPILENFTNSKDILKVLKQYNQLTEEVRVGISQIKYTPSKNKPNFLTIYMNDGNQVLINIGDISKKMPYYPQIAKEMETKQMKGIVDMEVGIYSYPYPEESEESAENEEDSAKDVTEESAEESTEEASAAENPESTTEMPTENNLENSQID